MSEVKTDLRVLRTRRSIMDAFIDLSTKKEFKDITIKDITTEAMINRATFYYHFEDIYDLLEKVLSEVLQIKLDRHLYEESELNEATIVNLFKAITDFQLTLSSRCHRGYEDTIARIIRDQLEVILLHLLQKHHEDENKDELKTASAMLSWGLYGASVEWRRTNKEVEPEAYIKNAIPFLFNGVLV